MSDVVLSIANHRGHVETLNEAEALLAVAIDNIINGTSVVFLEHIEIEHVLAHEHLFCHADDLVLAVFVEDDDVVEVRAVAYELVFLQPCADESVVAVDIQLLVRLGHLCRVDGVEVAYLRQSRMVLAIFVLEELEPVGGHLREVGQVAVYLLDFGLQAGHEFFGLVLIELQDALHLDFQQFKDVILGHLTDKGGVVGCQPFVDMLADGVDGGGLFEFLVFIDALLDEYLL